VALRHHSADGTSKLLIEFTNARGGLGECVLMPSHRPDRAAGCVSSQLGCAMGCSFCASTQNGLARDLTAGEIVEQFLHLKHEAMQRGRRLQTLVFMGMGEPLANLESVARAIHIIADSTCGNLGYRNITVSTVGLVPQIDQLADLDLGVHLAISLHAPDDATRSAIVPTTRRWAVAEIVAAGKRFQARTDRVVNIEYCLLADVNDSADQARLLASLLRGSRMHVNLIPYNSIANAEFRRPVIQRVQRFLQLLTEEGVVAHVRVTRGDDVSAACGQLKQSLTSRVSLAKRP
jgi:23S rRNA (adenine2503-C2)-methyltransferase